MEPRTRALIQRRIEGIRAMFWGVLALLGLAYFWVQVVKTGEMTDLAQRQALKNRVTPAPRGILYDRNGNILVDNRRALDLVVQAEDLPGDTTQVVLLAQALGRDPEELRRRIQVSRQAAGNRMVVLQDNLDDAELAQAELLRARFPFLSIQAAPRRAYLGEGLAGHAVGYVGEVDEELMKKVPDRYRLGEIMGKSGFEASRNDLIKGEDGFRRIVVDHLGREVSLMGVQKPVPGRSVYLTLDAGLQQVLQQSLGDRSGAGVVIDLRDGGILAMYSSPTLDPNLFLDRMTQEQVDYFWNNPSKPMLNRVTQGLYPPGSTFKLLMALAALDKGVITPASVVSCSGSKAFYGRAFKCMHTHGPMSVMPAIFHSCNIFFYEMGARLDIDDIHGAAVKYGLVEKTGIDLPHEATSRVPSRAWKERLGRTAESKKWYAGETISVAVGQGDTALTPIALARFFGTIATKGKILTPHLLLGFQDEKTGQLQVAPPPPVRDAGMKPEHWELLDQALRLVVQQGTAAASKIQGVEMAGKTGTAQVRSETDRASYLKFEKKFRNHALFAGYAPGGDNPQVAFAVVVENAGTGGANAAPVAKRLCEYWFLERPKNPLPPPGRKLPDAFRIPQPEAAP